MGSENADRATLLCKLYLARHGETEFNKTGLMMGNTGDSPLTDEGVRQAQTLGNELKHISFAAVFSSDLLRAKRTAEIATQEKQLAVQTTKALRERHYGVFENRPIHEYVAARKELQGMLAALTEEERHRYSFPHGLENDESVLQRMIPFLREVAVAYAGETVLVVAHGGILRAFLTHVGFLKDRWQQSATITNGAYILVESDGIDFSVREHKGIITTSA